MAASRRSKVRKARHGKAAIAPLLVRWPGHIQPGTIISQMFAALDWLPTFVDIAGGPKGDGLKKQIEAGQYPGIVRTTLDGFDQRDYLEGKSPNSAHEVFFYYSGSTPSAVRDKNWKMYYTMSQPGATGWLMPLTNFHWTMVQNIKRDPFEQSVGVDQKSATSLGGALGSPRHCLPVRLEHAAHRPAAVGERTRVVREVPASSSAGDLQPQWNLGGGQENEKSTPERIVVRCELDVTTRAPYQGARCFQ